MRNWLDVTELAREGDERRGGTLVFTLRVEDTSRPPPHAGLKEYATLVPRYTPQPALRGRRSRREEEPSADFYARFY
jgi:hypothetical protein